MATVNMSAPLCAGGEPVRVGVVLTALTDYVSIGEEGRGLDYKSGNNEEAKSFSFDQVVTVDNMQVLADLFSSVLPQGEEELFIAVSFIQFYPDDHAVDLLSPRRQSPTLVAHPVLGKCSSLFSVAVEWKLHPEEEEPEVCRSRLQLFRLAGGASRTDLRGVSPLLKVVDQTHREASSNDKILPFLLNDALTGNSRTALIYCINPQGLLDDETPCALALAQKASGLVTKATVYRWFPRANEQKIRESIVEQRNTMMSQGGSEVHNTFRLAELTQNLQLEYSNAQEQRRKLKEDHLRLIQEEVEKMERDLAQEPLLTEGPQRELLVLTRERRVLVLQIEALRAEAQQAEQDLQNQYQHQQTELHCLREESLQVFREFRQVSEEQRRMSESRYRSVLLEAVQDAVYLSAQNQELQADNRQLCKGACMFLNLNQTACHVGERTSPDL
ncbi:hypothetical protein EYF80_024973 [Liparis tanakae]|uniref:Kinesin motor domain-containing protein n=1 Tax=Liparis tanakae TaxID=230148 RepID=A0A4Z2HFY0_9TELE|nr:hypothetical protein EYF80_024973 [Liparis tanakae]